MVETLQELSTTTVIEDSRVMSGNCCPHETITSFL